MRERKYDRRRKIASNVIKTDYEAGYLRILDLRHLLFMAENSKGNDKEWYGGRLRMIAAFYQKSNNEIGEICNIQSQAISRWFSNTEIPNQQQLRQLSLLFEVPEEFFTQKDVVIKIKEQFDIIKRKA